MILQITPEELAAVISAALESAGIVATLSGGAAVAIYTDNQYVSKDLDFVTVALIDDLANALELALLIAEPQGPDIDCN